MSVTRRIERRRGIKFVKLEDTCGTVMERRGGRGWQNHGGAGGAEGRVGQPPVGERTRAGAGVRDGGGGGIGVKGRGDDVSGGVVGRLLLQRDLRV